MKRQKNGKSMAELLEILDEMEESAGNHIADSLIELLPLPNVYYDVGTQDYFIPKGSDEGWVRASRLAAQNYLISVGFNPTRKKNELQSEVEVTLLRIVREHYVEYAGQLAGFPIGRYEMNRNGVLVTTSPGLIEPKSGEFPLIKTVLDNLIGSAQLPYVYGWLKVALEMYRSFKWQPGQALALCGPKNAGKTLFSDLIKVLFGGRSSMPYAYMAGRTPFNNDLITAELLLIDDAAESTDYRSRRHFGAEIKKMTVIQDQRCERKFADAVMLRPLRRLLILLNDDAERMQVLPPLDDDIEDKIILIRVRAAPMPMSTGTPEEYCAFWRALEAELPMFAHFLQQWEIEPQLKSQRFGIREYHDYNLRVSLQAFSPENQLLTMIDEQIFDGIELSWSGYARELESFLKDRRASCVEAEKLLAYANSCGIYLARLEHQIPQRVSSRTESGVKYWTVRNAAWGSMNENDPDYQKELAQERRLKMAKAPGANRRRK